MSELSRSRVIEQIANEIIGYRWNIEDDIVAMNGPRSSTAPLSEERLQKSITEDKARIRALKTLAKKLGLWEEVEQEMADEEEL